MTPPENLPAVPDEVIEGEIVPDDGQSRPLPARVARVAVVVVRHPVPQATGRHVSYIGLGAAVVVRRLWLSRTAALYDTQLAAARAAGDQAAALEWEERRARFLRERHARRMDLIGLPGKALAHAPKVGLGALAVLGGTGVLLGVAERRVSAVAVPVEIAAHVVLWVAVAVSVAWGPVLLATPWITLAALYWAGRRHAATLTTGWLAPPREEGDEGGMVVTADTIVLALQHLRIAELKTAFREGWVPTFTTRPVRDGRGYTSVCTLPLGVTPEMVADLRPVLARNLHRAEIETWPTAGEEPGTLALWVADRGALDGMAPEYPLLHEGQADVFAGVPGGVTPRGDAILIPVVERNGVAGGLQGQGKSNTIRVVMLGCATDPLCQTEAFVFAYNGDFDAYAPRLARYEKGADDATVAAAVGRLEELADEVDRRESRLAELGAKKVTRGLAEKHPDMRPIVAAFSECHELFGHKEDGKLSALAKRAAELALKVIKRGRKTGIVLWFDTQSSRKEAIPPALVELVSVNVCLPVKTWRSNDGFLGDGSFAAGIRATELRPGRDRGRAVVTGVSDNQYEIVMWYFVEVDDDTGYDAAADVIARAMQLVDPATPVASGQRPVLEERDLLRDLDEILGSERVRLADVPALLRDLAPRWAPYRSLSGRQLRELLDEGGVRTTNPGNVPTLDPADLRDVLRGRGELAPLSCSGRPAGGAEAAGLTR